MKKIFQMTFVSTFLFYANLMALNPELRFISVPELTEEMLLNFDKGLYQDVIVECPAGLSLPVSFFLKGDFLSLEQTSDKPININVLKTMYIRFQGENLFFSLDANEWKNFSELFTGKIGFYLTKGEDETYLNLEAEISSKNES